MTDYDPRPPGRPPERDPVEPMSAPPIDPMAARPDGRGNFYLVAGALIAIVLAVGVLFYNPGLAPGERNDQARQPDRPTERIIEAPATPPRPTIPRQ
jgi:hypothetical protein